MGNLIVKSNAFVGASYRLKTTEQRLLLLAILKARETDNVQEAIGKTLTIHASDYMTHFGVDRATAYESLENAVNGLFETEYRYIELLPNNIQKMHRHRFTDYVAYSDGLGLVEIRFTAETVPLVVGLSENFTKYEIEQVSKLSSQYSLRLYEVLSQWRAKGQCTLELAELRFKFGLLDNEYPRMDNFKRKVLDMAVKEINKHTDLSVSYEQHKHGRVITSFTFLIKQKNKKMIAISNKSKEKKPIPKNVDLFNGFTDLERQAIQKRIDAHIKRVEARGELVDDFHRTNIMKSAVAERWGLDALAKKERRKQEQQAEIAKEKAQKQAEQKKKEQRQQEVNALKERVSEKLESLSLEQRESILNEVAKKIGTGSAYTQTFKKARDEGTAHTDTRFLKYFAECFNL